MLANSGTTGIYLATNTSILSIPSSRVRVLVNSVEITVGNGTTNSNCYFSNDDGSTARTYTNVSQGDYLYWNGDVAPYQLESDDTITFIHMVI